MSDISQEIADIQSAARGSEIRSPIVNALNKVNAGTLPPVSASDSKKILVVDSQGRWVASNEQYVPTPTGTLNISENGTYNVADKASAVVSVPTGPTPSGTIQITQNGTYDVTDKASAEVNVQGGSTILVPKTITQNGTYDPASDNADGYSNVIVNVSGGSQVVVSKTISQNGTYNPSDDNADAYSQVVVNVQGGGGDSDSNFLIAIGASGGSIYDTKASVVGSCAFYRRTRSVVNAMTGIEMTNASIVLESAFDGCISYFTHASFPMCTKISSYAFNGCKSLQEIYFPVCTIIDFAAFSNCTRLESVSFPLCEYISAYAFYSTAVISLCFPRCASISSAVFANCRLLKTITFPVCSTIGISAFSSCYALESAYFLSSSVVKLNNYAFNNTPMLKSSYLGYFGSIFVPESLVSAYKVASNWSSISDRITSYVEE